MNKKLLTKNIILIVITLILLTVSLFPFYYMIIQSFTDWTLVDQKLFTTNLTLDSYKYLFTSSAGSSSSMWLKALLNSFLVTIPTVIITIGTGLLVGFSLAKINFSGKKLIFNVLLFEMFFPAIILLVPRYLIVKQLANSYIGMILPLSVSLWAIFMYYNYFKGLPDSTFEAAKIDGANELRILFSFGIPFSKSVTTIIFLTTFMGRWSELMWDMLISPKIEYQTLNVLISNQFKSMGNLPGVMYAASVVLTVPIIILFLAFSKNFKEGINFMLK